jgi:hypothetical protein
MMRALLAIGFGLTFLAVADAASADSTKTIYTLPQNMRWIPDTTKGVPPGSYYAVLRGKVGDKCDEVLLAKFPDGFVYPWHVNHEYDLYTILKGTLVIGFNEHHRTSDERALPAGSFMQGLADEPHYGRAVGETIFEIYSPCPKV